MSICKNAALTFKLITLKALFEKLPLQYFLPVMTLDCLHVTSCYVAVAVKVVPSVAHVVNKNNEKK